jgi:hypothetical protein
VPGVVTVPVEPPGQSLARSRQHERAARPAALRSALFLMLVAGLPVVVLGGVALSVPAPRWLPYTGPWPLVHTGQTGYRVLGAAALLLAGGYLVLAVLAFRRRRWARTSVTALIAVGDVALALVLLADRPRLGWLLLGAVVLGCSLAGVVRGYQPEVDRYLADDGPHS